MNEFFQTVTNSIREMWKYLTVLSEQMTKLAQAEEKQAIHLMEAYMQITKISEMQLENTKYLHEAYQRIKELEKEVKQLKAN